MLVCVDPGHGGKDPGAIGPTGLQEKGVTLTLAEYVASKLRGRCDVILTRTSDVYMSPVGKAQYANRAKADLFVSIHCNAANTPAARGMEVFHARGSTSGKRLAHAIHDAYIREVIGIRSRGVHEAGYTVLTKTVMPAALIEVAFISNPDEENMLRDDIILLRMARGIANGITDYVQAQG